MERTRTINDVCLFWYLSGSDADVGFGLFRRLQVSNYSNLCEGSRCVDSSVLCAEYTSEESDNVEQ